MARYVVNVPEYLSRKKLTAGQFLVEFAEVDGGRSKVRDLPHPVVVSWADESTEFFHKTCRTAGAIFALFQRIAAGCPARTIVRHGAD